MYTTSPLSIYSEILTLALKQLKPIKYKLKSKGSVIFVPRTLQTRLGRMKTNIFCFILIALLGITISTSIAQQNGDDPKTNTEVEALRKRVSELEDKLKIVENVEKMELAAKLAEAQAKLIDAEYGKLKLELRESNQKWLIEWFVIFLTIIAAVGTPSWLLLKSGINKIINNLKTSADQLIADEVENSLNGFKDSVKQVDTLTNELKEAVEKVNVLEDQLRILNKEHAVSVLREYMDIRYSEENPFVEQINDLPERALLDIFNDEMYFLGFRRWVAEVLTFRESILLVSPLLNFLNSVVDSERYDETSSTDKRDLFRLVSFLSEIPTHETYEGLKTFLNRLLTENPRHKDIFLTCTVFSLAEISTTLGIGELTSKLKNVIQDLDFSQRDPERLIKLAIYFDKFAEPDGIKELFYSPLALLMGLEDVEKECLELLEKYDPEFVSEWNEIKAANRRTETRRLMNQNQQLEIPIQPVEQPILCSPYEEPAEHWRYDTENGEAVKQPGRREAGYWYKTERTGSAQLGLFQEEERDDLPIVNMLRADVKRWRETNYRNATNVTRELLRH